MKKSLAAVFLCLLCLIGCQQKNADDVYPYIYYDDVGDGQSVMKQFNVNTGKMYDLCMDPLCDHNTEDCPFAGLCQLFGVEDGNMYYSVHVSEEKSDGTYRGKAWRVYDLTTFETKELCRKTELRGGSLSEANSVAGDWQYICQSGDTDSYFRVNWKTGEIEDLSHLSEVILPQCETDDWLYAPIRADVFGDFIGMMRTDHAFENTEILFRVKDYLSAPNYTMIAEGYIYYHMPEDGGVYSLCRYDLKKEETETVLTGLLAAVVFEDGIVYTRQAEDPRFLLYDAWRKRDIYDEVGGKIYFCKPDGSKETTIFDDPELLIRALDMRRHQNKLVCDLNAIVEDEFDNGEMMPHVKAAEGGKLVIDLTTGEYRIYGKTW